MRNFIFIFILLSFVCFGQQNQNYRNSVTVLQELNTPVPDIILDLDVINPKATELTVTWSQPNLNGTTLQDYEVQYRECGFTTFATLGFSTTETFIATGLNSEQCYEFRTRARTAEGNSPFGNIDNAETTPDVPLFQFDYAMIATAVIDRVEVVALEATTITQNGTTVATLSTGQTQTITASQFDVFIGTGMFCAIGMNGIHTYPLTPNYAVGKKFSGGFIRNNPQTVSIYAVQDANVTVTSGGTVVGSQFIAENTGFNFVFNSTNVTVVIESDGLIMGSIRSNNNYDQRSLLPADKILIGFPSSTAVIYPTEEDTYGGVYRGDGTNFGGFGFHGTNERYQSGNTGSQYSGNSVTVKANNPVSGASFANSNGTKQAPFLGANFRYTNVGIPLAQDWIAFASTEPFTISTSNGNTYTSTGSSEAHYLRITAAADRAAGTTFTSTAPIGAWHQNQNEDPDESILLGW